MRGSVGKLADLIGSGCRCVARFGPHLFTSDTVADVGGGEQVAKWDSEPVIWPVGPALLIPLVKLESPLGRPVGKPLHLPPPPHPTPTPAIPQLGLALRSANSQTTLA